MCHLPQGELIPLRGSRVKGQGRPSTGVRAKELWGEGHLQFVEPAASVGGRQTELETGQVPLPALGPTPSWQAQPGE